MVLAYSEFVTTQANLLSAIRDAILVSTDWSRPNAAGKPNLLKCTTTRGADMIVDLEDAAPSLARAVMAVWRQHDGTTGVDKAARYLFWRYTTSGASAGMNVHVTVSADKDHLFISAEGPRPTETGAYSATYGSIRTYFFMCDLVPYHASDTNPVVVAGGHMSDNSVSGISLNNHQVQTSQGFNLEPWSFGKLCSVDFITMFTADTIQTKRECLWNDSYYLFPYVVVDDYAGLRGRLSSFFFAGYNQSTDSPEISTPAVGSKVQYDGKWYKLVSPCKGDGSSNYFYGQFGAVANTGSNQGRSVVIAIPCPAP